MSKVIIVSMMLSVASFASAGTPSISFDDGKNDLKVLIESVKDVSTVKMAPRAELVAEQTVEKAGQLSISCSSSEKMTIKGKLDEKKGKLILTDPTLSLGLNMYDGKPFSFDFVRYNRVNEVQYSFAKFSCDATAWESFDLSLPKTILSGEETGAFPAYFTVYTDDGNYMVPEGAVKLSCSVK